MRPAHGILQFGVNHCPFVKGCQLYPMFLLQASLKTWQIRYCEKDYTACARYQLAMKREPVPLQLLPNGKSLPIASKKPPPP